MTALPLRSLAPALLGASLIALAVCGGGAEARAPMSVGVTPEPTTVEEAQEQIARLHEQLGGGTAPTGDAQRVVPAEPVAPATALPDSSSSKGASKAAPSTEDSRCSNPCRALASMRRAVTALCRMTGDTDTRCIDAKRTLSDSERSVSRCSC